MSADLMLVCEERGENYEGNYEACCQVDETSGGDAHTDFGKLMQASSYEKIDEAFVRKVEGWFASLEHKEYVNINEVSSWLRDHIGTYLSLECW